MKENKVDSVQAAESRSSSQRSEGRTLDQRIHEAMGLCWHELRRDKSTAYDTRCVKCPTMNWSGIHPAYSSNISDAFKVVEWLREKGHTTLMDNETGLWGVDVYHPDGNAFESAANVSLPEAICLAALKAVEATRNVSPTNALETVELDNKLNQQP